jgi:hypothetical protein
VFTSRANPSTHRNTLPLLTFLKSHQASAANGVQRKGENRTGRLQRKSTRHWLRKTPRRRNQNTAQSRRACGENHGRPTLAHRQLVAARLRESSGTHILNATPTDTKSGRRRRGYGTLTWRIGTQRRSSIKSSNPAATVAEENRSLHDGAVREKPSEAGETKP